MIRVEVLWKYKPQSDIILWFVMHYAPAGFSLVMWLMWHNVRVSEWHFLELLAMTHPSHDCYERPVCKGFTTFTLYSRLSLKLMTLNAKGKTCKMSYDTSDSGVSSCTAISHIYLLLSKIRSNFWPNLFPIWHKRGCCVFKSQSKCPVNYAPSYMTCLLALLW